MRISFDYDNTITQIRLQLLAMQLIEDGNDVYIISARHDDYALLKMADKLGIARNRIFATGSNAAKVEKVKELKITRHYDDNRNVIEALPGIGKLVL